MNISIQVLFCSGCFCWLTYQRINKRFLFLMNLLLILDKYIHSCTFSGGKSCLIVYFSEFNLFINSFPNSEKQKAMKILSVCERFKVLTLKLIPNSGNQQINKIRMSRTPYRLLHPCWLYLYLLYVFILKVLLALVSWMEFNVVYLFIVVLLLFLWPRPLFVLLFNQHWMKTGF